MYWHHLEQILKNQPMVLNRDWDTRGLLAPLVWERSAWVTPRRMKPDAPGEEPGILIFYSLPRSGLSSCPAAESPGKLVGDCWVPPLEFMIEKCLD